MNGAQSWKARTIATLVVIAMVATAWGVASPYFGPASKVSGSGSGLDTRGSAELTELASSLDSSALEETDTTVLSEPRSAIEMLAQIESESQSPTQESVGVVSRAQFDLSDKSQYIPGSGPDGSETRSASLGTRGDQSLEIHLASVNAGGPYVGTEGDTIRLTATQSGGPFPLIFIRWDMDGDGVFERTPTYNAATGWSTDFIVDWTFNDNYYGEVLRVEAWDGVSTLPNIVAVNPFGNLLLAQSFFVNEATLSRNQALRIIPSRTISVTQLGGWRFTGFGPQVPNRLGLFTSAGVAIPGATCDPSTLPGSNVWRYCPIATTVLTAGTTYWINVRQTGARNYFGESFVSPSAYDALNPYTPGNVFPSRSSVSALFALPVTTDNFQCFLGFDCLAPVTLVATYAGTPLPNTVSDTAFLEIDNVAPVVFGSVGSPAVVNEGQPFTMTSRFTDPGLDDAWEYNIDWGDGTDTGWIPISKWKVTGTARVLILHSLGPVSEFTPADMANYRAICGSFCSVMDFYNYGPNGLNSVPSLATMLQYDVIVQVSNYFASVLGIMTPMGDRLADFMDLGGGVVTAVFSTWGGSNFFGTGSIRGRFDTQNYHPEVYTNVFAGRNLGFVDLGTKLAPGDFMLNGVGNIRPFYHDAATVMRANGVRVANWAAPFATDIALSHKANPVAGNGAQAVSLGHPIDWSLIVGFGQATGGDWRQSFLNSLILAKRANSVKSMPIEFSATHVYIDDNPSVTNVDKYDVTVRVRDDDNGKIKGGSVTYSADFNAVSFPAGWTEPSGTAWDLAPNPSTGTGRGPMIIWDDCWPYVAELCDKRVPPPPLYAGPLPGKDQILRSPSIDLSAVDLTADFYSVTYSATHNWQANGVPGPPGCVAPPTRPTVYQAGWIEASNDGFGSSTLLRFWEHLNPGVFTGTLAFDITALAAGQTNVQIQYRMLQCDDVWWWLDNFLVSATWGSVIDGLGEEVVDPPVLNVEPVALNLPVGANGPEAGLYTFSGIRISDPAAGAPTETFAYRVVFDDGTSSPWVLKGNLVPQFRVLIVHSLCGVAGQTCAEVVAVRNAFQAIGPFVTVNTYDMILPQPSAPSLTTMLTYDMVVVVTLFAFLAGPNLPLWVTARTLVGNNLADYQDLTGRGVLTYGDALHNLGTTPAGTNWKILGRYLNDDYSAFEIADTANTPTTQLGQIFITHPTLAGINPPTLSNNVRSATSALTIGGGSPNVVGQNGVLIANWANGATALGFKTLNNGARSVNLQMTGFSPIAAAFPQFLRNTAEYLLGSFPTPVIADISHAFGDNGIYRVDFQLLDDDMGYDLTTIPTTGAPTPVDGATLSISHNIAPVEVLNVDPVISSVRATFSGDLCLRLTGNSGHRLTLEVGDGSGTTSSVSLVRDGGNPEVACLTDVDINLVLGGGAYIKLIYDPADDNGASPSWLLEALHGVSASTQVLKVDFRPEDGYQERLIGFGDILRGMPITLRTRASDVGSDNLGVVWDFGDGTPFGIQAYEVADSSQLCGGANEPMPTNFGEVSIFTGCDDPIFERGDNTIRSPSGTGVSIDDVQSHAFTDRYLYYVMVMVLDDDNSEGYPSDYLFGGMDLEVLPLDFR